MTSWPIVNYKILVVIFSGLRPAEKIHLISNHILDSWGDLFYCFGGPLIFAVLYVFALPFPSRLALAFTLEQNKKNRALKQRIEDQLLLSLEDAKELRDRHKRELDALDQDNTTKDVKIKSLQDRNKQLEENVLASSSALGEARIKQQMLEDEIASLRDEFGNKDAVIGNLENLLESERANKRESLETYQYLRLKISELAESEKYEQLRDILSSLDLYVPGPKTTRQMQMENELKSKFEKGSIVPSAKLANADLDTVLTGTRKVIKPPES